MNILEKCLIKACIVRHSILLNKAEWLWNTLRPYYENIFTLLYQKGIVFRNGIEYTINGTDRISLMPVKFRSFNEIYEPEVWKHIMAQVQPGDIIADVGANVGLYTVALGKRAGSSGKVFAFEPDPENFNCLKEHVDLNDVSDRVVLIQTAVSSRDGVVSFMAGRGVNSCVSPTMKDKTQILKAICLDTVFANGRLDLLKIDVEGYEEEVLRGATKLLQDSHGGPRAIYIEVHPYCWPAVGTTSNSILALLSKCGYRVVSLDGKPLENIRNYGEIIAYRQK